MRRIALVLALTLLHGVPTAHALPVPLEIAHGHIQLGGPWTRYYYSFAVMNDHDDIDGFFFDVTPYLGKKIQAVAVRTTPCVDPATVCAPADLDINFHDLNTPGDPYWAYRGGCSTSARNETCTVPKTDVTRGEVSGFLAYEVDVTVFVLNP